MATQFVYSQKLSIDTLLTDDISIRAIEIADGKVFYAGTQSKFGFVDYVHPEQRKQIRLSEKDLQFRTLAQNRKYFFTVNIESPACFFRIDKKTLKHKITFQDHEKTAFYDAFRFVHNRLGVAFSDPAENRRLNLMVTDGRRKWKKMQPDRPLLADGEAAFAASNSTISFVGNRIWIATGGKKSRIFRTKTDFAFWEIFDTPIVQGTSSEGIFSIDFYDENKGIAAGGDYTRQNENVNTIATTSDGGKTWKIQASGANSGYTTFVKYRPGSGGKEIIAMGDQHISFSCDGGKTWKKISDEKNLYTSAWLDANTLILAGKNRILKMKLTF